MNPPHELPVFIHDTQHILNVNQAGCDLFRCEREALIDLDMVTLVAHEDFQGLARLRLKIMRTLRIPPAFEYKYRRCDGTMFWAKVETVALSDGKFATTLIYKYEAR